MDIVELAYNELRWEERIQRAGGIFLDQIQTKKCRYGLVGVISFISGIITAYALLFILVTIL